MTQGFSPTERSLLNPGHLEDLKLAATKMHGEVRRSFQVEMALKYCASSAR